MLLCGTVPDAAVRLLTTGEDQFDVELNVDLDDVQAPAAFAAALHAFARELASRSGVRSYFAGLEPACDEDTRIFTGEVPGPLHLKG